MSYLYEMNKGCLLSPRERIISYIVCIYYVHTYIHTNMYLCIDTCIAFNFPHRADFKTEVSFYRYSSEAPINIIPSLEILSSTYSALPSSLAESLLHAIVVLSAAAAHHHHPHILMMMIVLISPCDHFI